MFTKYIGDAETRNEDDAASTLVVCHAIQLLATLDDLDKNQAGIRRQVRELFFMRNAVQTHSRYCDRRCDSPNGNLRTTGYESNGKVYKE